MDSIIQRITSGAEYASAIREDLSSSNVIGPLPAPIIADVLQDLRDISNNIVEDYLVEVGMSTRSLPLWSVKYFLATMPKVSSTEAVEDDILCWILWAGERGVSLSVSDGFYRLVRYLSRITISVNHLAELRRDYELPNGTVSQVITAHVRIGRFTVTLNQIYHTCSKSDVGTLRRIIADNPLMSIEDSGELADPGVPIERVDIMNGIRLEDLARFVSFQAAQRFPLGAWVPSERFPNYNERTAQRVQQVRRNLRHHRL